MQGTIHRSLRTGLFGVGWALVAAAASAALGGPGQRGGGGGPDLQSRNLLR